MESEGMESLPLYPEGRACRRPTARKVIDLFEDVQRYELSAGHRPAVVFNTKLISMLINTPSHRRAHVRCQADAT